MRAYRERGESESMGRSHLGSTTDACRMHLGQGPGKLQSGSCTGMGFGKWQQGPCPFCGMDNARAWWGCGSFYEEGVLPWIWQPGMVAAEMAAAGMNIGNIFLMGRILSA
ncbi:hypothetical protein [Sphingobacterium lactis]|uniref:hypothetical protein n=1 Tax=Sphingobacterium lactis TaxID=797291 RepID=UPI0011B070CD|nr:hypothetical protein [Sphingobacterium lactis]